MTHPDGSLKGYGFVEYHSRESTLAAIRHLNNRCFRGRQIVVKLTKPAGDGAKRMPTIHTSSPHGRRVTYGMSETTVCGPIDEANFGDSLCPNAELGRRNRCTTRDEQSLSEGENNIL